MLLSLDPWDLGSQKLLQEVEMPWLFAGFWWFPVSWVKTVSARCTGTVFTEHSCIFVQGCYEPLRGKLSFFLWNPSICHVGVPPGPPLPSNAQGHLRTLWRLWISCSPTLNSLPTWPPRAALSLLLPSPTPRDLLP